VELSQVCADGIDPLCGSACDVLDDDPSGPKLPDNPGKFKPQAAAATSKARALSCAGHILAWESAADDIDGRKVSGSDVADIVEARRFRPVLGEDASAVLVPLDLPDSAAESGPFKAKLEPSDAREQRANSEGFGGIHPLTFSK
jgi:hypothetical protein